MKHVFRGGLPYLCELLPCRGLTARDENRTVVWQVQYVIPLAVVTQTADDILRITLLAIPVECLCG